MKPPLTLDTMGKATRKTYRAGYLSSPDATVFHLSGYPTYQDLGLLLRINRDISAQARTHDPNSPAEEMSWVPDLYAQAPVQSDGCLDLRWAGLDGDLPLGC